MSFDFETGPDQIVKTFSDFWAERCPVAYPRDDSFKKPSDQEWLQFTIQTFGAGQSSVGSPGANRHDRPGLLTINVFSPNNDAENVAATRAKEIVNFYMSGRKDGIRYERPNAEPIGKDPAGYYQTKVTIEFLFEQYG